ncbi:MAG: peptide chain release factor N(5)-glutamine methyltransferase [Synergistes sp.]|nr:peptide chain release factor N(5)-glutamine methyltransferase [Synergistes sp.]
MTESNSARPEYSADTIIAHRLSLERAELLYKDDEIPAQLCEGIFSAAAKRAKGVPLSYVLHEAEFFGYKFKVGRGVLIPRPETELLVEAALEHYSGRSACFADWCTGSGCIGLSLLLQNSALRGVGVDKSRAALKWASINGKFHGLADKFTLVRNEEPEKAPFEPNSFDFIIANPPYIPSREISSLMSEVRDYEPHTALDGGEEGLDLYEKFFKAFPQLLKEGGMLFCEIGGEPQVHKLECLSAKNFILVNKIYDYNGLIRHIIWRKK